MRSQTKKEIPEYAFDLHNRSKECIRNAGSLREWPVMARISSPIAKTGIPQDMITELRDGGQKKVVTTTHTHTQRKRELWRERERM